MTSKSFKIGFAGLLSVSLVVAGCGGASDEATQATPVEAVSTPAEQEEIPVEVDANAEEETSGSIEVDEGLLSTEIRLPIELFTLFSEDPEDVPSQEEIQAAIDAEGRNIEVTINDDNTVTYRMSRNEFNRFKSDLKASVDESIQEALNEEANIFKSVTYTDDMREFNISVDRKAFENSYSFLGFGLVLSGSFYQIFTGVEDDDVYVLVNYVDEKTGKVFDTYDSRTLNE